MGGAPLMHRKRRYAVQRENSSCDSVRSYAMELRRMKTENLTSVRAVAFDIDGVLVDIRFPTVLPTALGISADQALEFFDGPFQRCLLGAEDLKDVLPPFLRAWRWPGTYDSFIEFWFREESHINWPMLQVARRLREVGVKCILASTQEYYRARSLERLLQLGQIFEHAYFSCDLALRKPDPRFFKCVANQLALDPGSIFLIDDQYANIEGARLAGWRASLYRSEGDVKEVLRACGVSDGD